MYVQENWIVDSKSVGEQLIINKIKNNYRVQNK